ncbi:MAG: 16S rRNA (cytidine(1402)-2'-O)-methyltransferase [Thermodesulfobacteriota bacterium]
MEIKGTLYIVSTPIGNLEDITLRALRVLREVDIIVAEDTRRTWKLLSRYNISATLTSYFEHNERIKGPVIISRLKEGKDVALVSDAGTPGISDPGYRLIRLAIEDSIKVTPIPGPSAIISALSISGLPTDSFAFYGFLPRKPGTRKNFLARLKEEGKTIIIYESPYRVIAMLRDVLAILGDIDGVMTRELTKLHEEVVRGKVSEIIETLKERTIKGEVTFILGTKNKRSK